MLAGANSSSCIGPQNKIGHPDGCKFPCSVPAEYGLAPKYVFVVLVLCSEIVDRLFGMNNLEID